MCALVGLCATFDILQFAAAIDGSLTTLSTTELYGGARINFIFNEALVEI
jgi:hypothetical protein